MALRTLFTLFVVAAAHPENLLCSTPVEVGSIVMGKPVVLTDDRTVQLTRGGRPVACGGAYVAGEQLVATLSSTAGQYLLDALGSTLAGGRCDGSRVDWRNAVALTAPASGNLTVRAAWAPGRSSAVTKTPDCTLHPTQHPALAPTAAPSPTPTVTAARTAPTEPTPAPTLGPTPQPTSQPMPAPTPPPTPALPAAQTSSGAAAPAASAALALAFAAVLRGARL
mmetsp:Transcript_4721/g.16892  ORF Transcript_4721/g.16892 Transcript_4721/m.16892 type:complete len:224 (+) Transcript_4721:121-792(+)